MNIFQRRLSESTLLRSWVGYLRFRKIPHSSVRIKDQCFEAWVASGQTAPIGHEQWFSSVEAGHLILSMDDITNKTIVGEFEWGFDNLVVKAHFNWKIHDGFVVVYEQLGSEVMLIDNLDPVMDQIFEEYPSLLNHTVLCQTRTGKWLYLAGLDPVKIVNTIPDDCHGLTVDLLVRKLGLNE